MGDALIGTCTIGGNTNGGNTFHFVGTAYNNGGFGSEMYLTVRTPGIISKMGGSTDSSGTGKIFTVQKNGSNQSLSVTFTNGVNDTEYDNTDTVHYDAGDTAGLFLDNDTGTIEVTWVKYIFTADSGHVSMAGSPAGANDATGSGTKYQGFFNGAGFEGNENNQKTRMRTAGTFRNLWISVAGNDNTTTATFVFRKNGAVGNNTISVAGGATGTFEDTTNTDTFVSGDDINIRVSGGDVNINNAIMTYHFIWAIEQNDVLGTTFGNPTANASNQYTSIIGNAFGVDTDETRKAIQHGFAVKTSNFRINVVNNNFTSTATYRVRKNSANGNQSFTVGSGSSGWFEDSTNSDIFAPTDTIDYSLSGGTANDIDTRATLITEIPLASSIGMGQICM